jgi:hypothetical protein
VRPRFKKIGELEPADFYMVLILKAARAKNYHKKRLTNIAGSFKKAVRKIASELHRSTNHKHRLQVLMHKWRFSLPTASAILTFLYPNAFTVYDWRVCKEVKCDYKSWHSRRFSDALWSHYESFNQEVINKTPAHLSLRDNDRFLIGRSTRRSIEHDCKS